MDPTPSNRLEATQALRSGWTHQISTAALLISSTPADPPLPAKDLLPSYFVVVIIAAVVFIVGSFCLINCGKVAVSREDPLPGIVVAVLLED